MTASLVGCRRIAVLLTCIGLAGACTRAAAPPSHASAGILISPAIAKPAFVLTDMQGRPYDFRARTHARVTFLFFGYTHCPDVCPLQMANLAGALKRAGPQVSREVTVVFVTTDSARDTPERLRQWLSNFDTTFVGLTAPLERVNKIQDQLRFLPRAQRSGAGATYGIDHSAVVIAFAQDDSAHVVYPAGVQSAAWAADLEKLVK